MDRIERIESGYEALLLAFEGWQAGMWTTLPGVIQSFDSVEMTVVVQPTIQAQKTNKETGEKTWISMPLLVDVPIVIQSAGGMSITLPIAAGDECLVSFSSRCIDAWWQSGGVQVQAEYRMHDLSDGFAFIGPKSIPNIIQGYSTTTLQVRSDDGVALIDIHPTTHLIAITGAGITINGPLTVNGATNIIGAVTTTGTLANNGKAVGSTHTHSDPQGGSTGVPT